MKATESAQAAIGKAMDSLSEQVLQVTEKEMHIISKFQQTKGSIALTINKNDDARKLAHACVDDEFNQKTAKLRATLEEARNATKAALIEIGAKEPDKKLCDNVVVQVADTTVVTAMAGVASIGGFLKSRWNLATKMA